MLWGWAGECIFFNCHADRMPWNCVVLCVYTACIPIHIYIYTYTYIYIHILGQQPAIGTNMFKITIFKKKDLNGTQHPYKFQNWGGNPHLSQRCSQTPVSRTRYMCIFLFIYICLPLMFICIIYRVEEYQFEDLFQHMYVNINRYTYIQIPRNDSQ